jgi:superoxide dismutase
MRIEILIIWRHEANNEQALEPVISKQIMELHHQKHHSVIVDVSVRQQQRRVKRKIGRLGGVGKR